MRPAHLPNRSLVIFALFFAMLGVAQISCGAVVLSDLIMNDGKVDSGDKRFDQFSYSATGDMPASSDVQIVPFELNGQYGIRVFGGFIDRSGGGASTATLGYRVSVLDPNLAINGAGLQGNPAVLSSGFFTIEGSFSTSPTPTVLTVFDEVPGGTLLADTATFDSVYPTMEVELTLTGDTTSETEGAVTASFVNQTFSQGVVPEPNSMIIWMGSALLFGAVSLAYRRWVPSAVPRHLAD